MTAATDERQTEDTTGFPVDTPLADMTVDEQLAYWKRQARRHEGTAKALLAERATDSADEVARAVADGRAELLADLTPQLVTAAFRIAAVGILTADQVDELLEDRDLTGYVDDRGAVDDARVARTIAALKPTPTTRS